MRKAPRFISLVLVFVSAFTAQSILAQCGVERWSVKTGTDADIKQFARTTLATIEEHDRIAHEIANSLTAVGSSRPPR